MSRTPRILLLAAVAAMPALALSGCTAGDPSAGGDGRLLVVSSTDVYASVVGAIGGDLVDSRALIGGSAQDPHSYEATARDQLEVADAALVVRNGGGYDPFMDALVDASGTTAPVITAVEASGLLGDEHEEGEEHADEGDDHDHIEGFNEHVWYSVHAMEHIAEAIETELIELLPGSASEIGANADAFLAGLEAIHESIHEYSDAHAGARALVTEPVPLYLLEDLGFENVTPEAFTEAVEEGDDISVAVLDEVLTLASSGAVALLGYNDQTTGAETERVRAAAEGAGVPVVAFTETLPEGEDYLSWMTANVEAVAAAVP